MVGKREPNKLGIPGSAIDDIVDTLCGIGRHHTVRFRLRSEIPGMTSSSSTSPLFRGRICRRGTGRIRTRFSGGIRFRKALGTVRGPQVSEAQGRTGHHRKISRCPVAYSGRRARRIRSVFEPAEHRDCRLTAHLNTRPAEVPTSRRAEARRQARRLGPTWLRSVFIRVAEISFRLLSPGRG